MFDGEIAIDKIIGEDVVVQPAKYEDGEHQTLHKVFSLLARGWTSKKIRKEFPEILPETITVARGILVGRNSDYFSNTKNEKIFHDFKVLIDENVNPATAGYLRMHFKKAVHVHDVGLKGRPDEQVWEWAINNSYDVIFTKDCANKTEEDLTRIAILEARSIIRAEDRREKRNITLSALPLLVHLPGTPYEDREFKRLLRRNKDEFFSYLDNRSTPYLDVRKGAITCGPTYFELRAENQIEDLGVSKQDVAFEKSVQKQRVKRALYSHLTNQNKRDMTPERQKRIDDFINAAVGMGNSPYRSSYLASGVGIDRTMQYQAA